MALVSLRNHPKFVRLVHVLREPVPHVLGYLECLWHVGYQSLNTKIGDEIDVGLACQYPAAAPNGAGCPPNGAERIQVSPSFAHVTKALLECGFIDKVGEMYHIHDLFDHAPDYVQKRMARKVASCPPNGAVRRRTAPTKPNQTEPYHTSASPKKKQRKRNLVFDAIAEVTGTDPATNGSLIGKVSSALGKADPPYSADDVREFGRRFWEFCPYAAKDRKERPTPNEIQKNIGMIRATPAQNHQPESRYPTAAEVVAKNMEGYHR